jgi:hypothetical protein
MTRFSSATTRTRNCAISVCVDSGVPRPDRWAVLLMSHRGRALPRYLCAGAHKEDHDDPMRWSGDMGSEIRAKRVTTRGSTPQRTRGRSCCSATESGRPAPVQRPLPQWRPWSRRAEGPRCECSEPSGGDGVRQWTAMNRYSRRATIGSSVAWATARRDHGGSPACRRRPVRWAAAVRHSALGRVLDRMHRAPERNWTVAEVPAQR